MGEPWKPGGPVRLSDEQFKALDELMSAWSLVTLNTFSSVFGDSTRKAEVRAGLDRARQAARRALTGDQS